MDRTFQIRYLVFALLALTFSTAGFAQNANNPNVKILRPYLAVQPVTKLEWELMQFNFLWLGAYSTPASYLTSLPVFFDPKNLRFKAIFRISERREYQDSEPWSSLSKVKRESILREAVEEVTNFLGTSFPEVKTQSSLLFVEFKYRQEGGAFVEAARYENGQLQVRD